MPTVSQADLEAALKNLPGWIGGSNAISKLFELNAFTDAIALVNRIAAAAEAADHHPDIDIRYNKLHITLSTHSEGGVTEKDIALAAQIEKLASAG
jgi:4a-hydroxytetrahydrobiopterin dehydratase